MSSFTLYTAPTSEPVSLEEAKAFLRLAGSDEDPLLAVLIKAAREFAETFTGRQCLTAVYDYYLDQFPKEIELPRTPLQSITHVKYYDETQTLQTLSTASYIVDATKEPPRIVEGYCQYWPTTIPIVNAVQVRGVFGYTSDSLIPSPLKLGILQLISHFYENREIVYAGTILSAEVPLGLRSLLYSVKVPGYA